MTEGFFKLKRSFFSHWLWDEDVVFHRRESFLDLLQLAAFAPTKRVVKGRLINVPVGGIVASERFLSERWKWSRTKVRHFLSLLEEDGMLEQEKDQGQTVLILCNYGKHARLENHEKTRKEPPEDHTETRGEPNKKKVKKGEKEKKSSVGTQAIAWSPTNGWTGITDQDRKDWREAYPACNIDRQLASMTQWLKSNPAKAKKTAWRRFLTNWLNREQNSGGDIASNKSKPNDPTCGVTAL